ncbi:MAG: hypothetical protein QMD22_00340 [archaeon]|nr:hypothetical protein [archaeon]
MCSLIMIRCMTMHYDLWKRCSFITGAFTKNKKQRSVKMMDYRTLIRLLAIGCVIAALVGVLLLSGTKQEWRVTDEGLLEYPPCTPDYETTPLETTDEYTLNEVRFTSRGMQIAGLLRMPQVPQGNGILGVVLLPGATVTKEGEQGLATYLCSLGYASITLDQRNLGVIDMQGDLQIFLNGEEPTEHKMVHDARAAAEVLRNQPEIDPERIVYVGGSNGARFAIIAYNYAIKLHIE